MTAAAPAATPSGALPIPARAGIGLRARHHAELLLSRPSVTWLEAHTENYFHDGGPAVAALEQLAAIYPLSLHGVGLGLGSADPLDREHLRRLRAAERRYRPALLSEHACWTHVDGEHYNDLLPLPYTEEAASHLARRVSEVQDWLGRQILVENLSVYTRFAGSQLSEGEFLAAVVAQSGCGLLLDVNNAYVNARNVGLDLDAFLVDVPASAVQEIHLAGHTRRAVDGAELLIDDHGSRVCDDVWGLYSRVLFRLGPVPTLIEWDTDVPALDVLLDEAQKADAKLRALCADAA